MEAQTTYYAKLGGKVVVPITTGEMAPDDEAEFAALFSGKTFTEDEVSFTAAVDGAVVTFTSTERTAISGYTEDIGLYKDADCFVDLELKGGTVAVTIGKGDTTKAENLVAAIEALRDINDDWYIILTDVTDEDCVKALCKWAEGMTSAAFCAKAVDIADNYKTSYMLGPWGWPATDKMITRVTTQGSNAKTNRQWLSQANAIKGEGFLFDCVGLIKGILWGWDGDMGRTYGGAGYACNGVPDYDAKKMIDCCRDVSTDFSTIVPGEAVWMDGHIGVYVGGGVVVEATPKWRGGVQWSVCLNVDCDNICYGAGARTWTKHGKLPWVDYAAQKNEIEEDEDMPKYRTLKDVPDSYRPTIRKLMERGALRGESDPDPNSLEDNVLNLSEDYCRVMTTLDRLEVLG